MSSKLKFDGIIAALLVAAPFMEQVVAVLPPGGKAALIVGALLKVVTFLRYFVPKPPAPVTVLVSGSAPKRAESPPADGKDLGG